jgi:hypothetical protein
MGAALRLWPELAGMRIRPLLVSAFGDIYVESSAGEVWVAQPLELSCERVQIPSTHCRRCFRMLRGHRSACLPR